MPFDAAFAADVSPRRQYALLLRCLMPPCYAALRCRFMPLDAPLPLDFADAAYAMRDMLPPYAT